MATMSDMEHTEGVGRERERPAETPQGGIPSDTFAARLLLARHHAGRLSQREAAEKCGLNYASWSNWEEGRRPRDLLEVVQQIAEALDIDRTWLLFGGPLLPARGRPTRSGRRITDGYPRVPVYPTRRNPIGGAGGARYPSTKQAVRRPRVIDRNQPVAA
jgi:transcriptional regulator with XRE-family HTH domain